MLSKEIRENLKKEYPNDTLKVVPIGDFDIVFRIPSIEDVSAIRTKQYELYIRPNMETFKEKLEANEVPQPSDIPADNEKDRELAKFIAERVLVYPKVNELPEPIIFAFSEWFLEKYVYINIGQVEDL